jgi:hypothetical protein
MYMSVIKFIKTKNRIVVSRGWEKAEMGRFCLMGTEFLFSKMKGVLEMKGSDGCSPSI